MIGSKAGEKSVVGVELVVEARVVGVGEVRLLGGEDEVVAGGAVCGVGRWVQLEKIERDGVDCHAGGVRVGCDNGRRAGFLRDGGNGAERGQRSGDEAKPFRGAEKEGAVLEDGAAERTAEVILTQLRNALADGKGGVLGVETIVLDELVGGAVEVVGAALGEHADDAAGAATGFRGVVVGLHGDFFDRIE